MVELPRNEVFENVQQAGTAPTAEAPGIRHRRSPLAVAAAAETPKKTGRKLVKRAVLAVALLAGVAFAGRLRPSLLDRRPLHRDPPTTPM